LSQITSKTFYEQRDSRTLALADNSYQNKRVLIAINDDLLGTFNGQVMLFTAFNLISRFCRSIDIMCNQATQTIYLPAKFTQKGLLML
jgi:hypothetical protein